MSPPRCSRPSATGSSSPARRPANRQEHAGRLSGAADHRARYLTLDDAAVLAAAHADPTGFIDSLAGGAVVLHEVQRAPELLLPIKVSVDRGRRPISRSARIPLTTLKRYLALFEMKRYLALFEMTFLVQLVPPWFTSLGKRLVKTPSCTVADSGLLAYLLGMTSERLTLDSTVAGPVLESFAVMEIRKQLAWSTVKPRLFYFRTSTDDEVDVVLEGRGGKLTAVEIKASATIGGGDFKAPPRLGRGDGKAVSSGRPAVRRGGNGALRPEAPRPSDQRPLAAGRPPSHASGLSAGPRSVPPLGGEIADFIAGRGGLLTNRWSGFDQRAAR